MLNLKQSGIYRIRNLINNKGYGGKAICIRDRWKNHRCDLRNDNHDNEHLQRAWNKYGEENFVFEVLEFVGIELLSKQESYWVKLYNYCDPNFGYNNMIPDESGRSYHSLETIEKIRNCKTREERRKDNAHLGIKCEILSPNGELVKIDSISAFCIDMGFKTTNISNIVSGKRRSYRGWTNPEFKEYWDQKLLQNKEKHREAVRSACKKSFTLKSPDGEIIEFVGFQDFTKKYHLGRRQITALLKGEKKSHRGWTTV